MIFIQARHRLFAKRERGDAAGNAGRRVNNGVFRQLDTRVVGEHGTNPIHRQLLEIA